MILVAWIYLGFGVAISGYIGLMMEADRPALRETLNMEGGWMARCSVNGFIAFVVLVTVVTWPWVVLRAIQR